MRPALAETRTAFAAQTAAFTVALPEDDATKDVATTIMTLEKHAKAKATPLPQLAEPKDEAVAKGTATSQAGKGGGKEAPTLGGLPDGDVALRGSPDGKPQTAAEKNAAKQERQALYERPCSTNSCNTCVKWDHMLCCEVPSSDDEAAPPQLCCECAACLALRRNINEQEACMCSSEKRNAESETMLEQQVALMSVLTETKKGMKRIRHITMESFRELWTPLMEAIDIKTRHMFILCEAQEQQKTLCEELRTCVDQARAKEIFDRVQSVAASSDEWVKGIGPSGTFWVRMFWVCQKRTHPSRCEGDRRGRCLSMTISKAWRHNKKDDPLAEGQPWTCMCQRNLGYSAGRFRAWHGVLCEIKLPGGQGLCYVTADAPDEHINDVRAIHYDLKLDPATPEALYDTVPIAHPRQIHVAQKHPIWVDWYQISPEDFDACPKFSWWSIFGVTGMQFEPTEVEHTDPLLLGR